MNKATLRLFNSIQVKEKTMRGIDKIIFNKRTIPNGYILDPSIVATGGLLDQIESIVGLSGEKANAAFHKFWAVVKDSSIEDLVVQQIIHYFTTYGLEALGIYNSDVVYIPNEALEIPELKAGISLVFIKAMTPDDILEKIIILGSKTALADHTLKDIMTIVKANGYDSAFVERIGNHELKSLLYDYYDIAPTDPVDFLRYLVVKLTEQSLLIKNDMLIETIKQANGQLLDKLLKNAPKNLASIFLRYKPIFLAMKSISDNKTFFNRLRKDAKTMHIPLPVDYMNSVTSQIKDHRLSFVDLERRLSSASVFRKIRLAYALSNRLNAGKSIVYKIRNGRGWVDDFAWSDELQKSTEYALDIVIESIAKELHDKVKGKTFYIPGYVHYALPATEKQFVGFLPSNSYVVIPNDIVIGIHWMNVGNWRVDLDFSMLQDSGKFGWDSYYRSQDGEILFSGDMTDASGPRGASELFYINRAQEQAKLLMINYYNYDDEKRLACKFFVAHEHPGRLDNKYVVDPNNILLSTNIDIDKKETSVGLLIKLNGENRLYFSATSLGNAISCRNSEIKEKARNYTMATSMNPLTLESVLSKAGAIVVDRRPYGDYVDLSPESLDKTSIIGLFND